MFFSDVSTLRRSHFHTTLISACLSCQSEQSAGLNSTFDQRLRSLEARHAEADTLLHVHASLLFELQTQLRNLSATVQRLSRNAGCTINIIKTPPLLGMRDILPPGSPVASWGVGGTGEHNS